MTAGRQELDAQARAAVAASDWTAAVDAFAALARTVPRDSRPWYSLGLALTRAGLGERAAGPLRRALALSPAHAKGWSLLASVAGVPDGHLRAAVLPGANLDALRIAAALKQKDGDAAAAARLLDVVLAEAPDDLDCRTNRAMARIELGLKSLALEDIAHVLESDPEHPRARWARGWIRLGRGDWDAASDYAARWLRPEADSRQHQFALPLWDGGPLAHGPLLLWGQFGVGDEILFSTLVEAVATQAASPVVLEVDPRLVRLLSRGLPGVTVVPRLTPPDPRVAEARPAAQSSLARLPAVLPRDLVLGRTSSPIMQADPERVAHWRRRFAAMGPPPYRGLAWRSGNRRTASRKSIPLADLAPVLRAAPGTWISLQYDPDPDEIREVAAGRRPVPHDNPAADIRGDIDELAAQVAALDLVVTISGTTAHLAGALGRPGLVLMQRDPLWFWFETGEAVPWYPSLTILRQRGTAWAAVIADAAARLGRS